VIAKKKLFIETDLQAPNKRIVTVDFSKPTPSNWVDFIDISPSTGAGFSPHERRGISSKQYDKSGKMQYVKNCQQVGTAGGFGGKKKTKHYIIF
jgi:prolyl oligopeptidase